MLTFLKSEVPLGYNNSIILYAVHMDLLGSNPFKNHYIGEGKLRIVFETKLYNKLF